VASGFLNRAVQKGINTDLNIRGQSYHIQTEDWGSNNPFIVTRIFCNGAVLKTIKTSYEQAFRMGSVKDTESILQALRRQHQFACENINKL
jgi:hypothetical protein